MFKLARNLVLISMLGIFIAPAAIAAEDKAADNYATLFGEDANEDGIRDDVELTLESIHRHSVKNLEIARYVAKGYNDSLKAVAGLMNYDDVALRMMMSVDCLMYHTNLNTSTELTIIEVITFNTPERAKAFEAFNVARNGTIQGDIHFTPDDCRYKQK